MRDYQQKLFDLIINDNRHTLAVAPCGAGKSVIMSELVNYYSKKGKRVLFMVHRNSLLDQFNSHLSKYEGLQCDVLSPIMAEKSDNKYDIIFIDETHHATSSTFQKVFDKHANARRIGFTATPIRLSGERLAKPINEYQNTPFEVIYQTITIRELVDMNFLAPFKVKAVDYTLFFDDKAIKTVGGEYSSKSVAEAFKQDKLPETVAKFLELAKGRKTIAYTSTIEMADMLTEELVKQGANAKAFHSKLSANTIKQYIDDFKNNKISVCVNVDLFGEGFDVPDCDCVLMLRPTKSLSLYIQQFMRAMRRDPNRPDKEALIIDFANNTKTHGSLYTAELRMNLKQSEELLKYCPNCETLNYAKARKCDNPDCRYTFPTTSGKKMLASKEPEEIKVGMKMAISDLTLNEEILSIAKINEDDIKDITTKFIHRLCLIEGAKTSKKLKSTLEMANKRPIYYNIDDKQLKPNLKVINLACEQLGFSANYDIDYFRKAYLQYKEWQKKLEEKQAKANENMQAVIKYYKKLLHSPHITLAKKREYYRVIQQYENKN